MAEWRESDRANAATSSTSGDLNWSRIPPSRPTGHSPEDHARPPTEHRHSQRRKPTYLSAGTMGIIHSDRQGSYCPPADAVAVIPFMSQVAHPVCLQLMK
eukprot:5834008-Amphidinium_carterae.1